MSTTKKFYHLNFCHLSAANFAVLPKHTCAWLLWLVSLPAESRCVSKGTVCEQWVRAQSSQLLTWLLLECGQAGVSPAAGRQLRVCFVCKGGFGGRTGFCPAHLEVFWMLGRHGKKEAIPHHENGQYMIHLKLKKKSDQFEQ